MTKLMTKEILNQIERELNQNEYLVIEADTDHKYEIEYQKAYLVTMYVMKDFTGEVRAKFNSYMTPNMYASYINGELEEYV